MGLLCGLLAGAAPGAIEQLQAWLAVALVVAVVAWALVGVWLGWQLRRALLWRRRRNPRPSREVQAERQRIARDLHDGVGSQLVHASMLLDHRDPRQAPVQEVIEHCLLEMRMLVDRMGVDDGSLTDRLAVLRYRLQPVLDRRGIGLRWQVPDIDQQGLPAGAFAQEVAAIVQEALSNALQHAHAAQLAVTLELQQGEWHLQVLDDGLGMPQGLAQPGAGKGLRGMAQRAALLGARLEGGPGLNGRGAGIHLHWPVGAALRR